MFLPDAVAGQRCVVSGIEDRIEELRWIRAGLLVGHRRQPRKHIAQVLLRVDAVALARFEQRVEDRAALPRLSVRRSFVFMETAYHDPAILGMRWLLGRLRTKTS